MLLFCPGSIAATLPLAAEPQADIKPSKEAFLVSRPIQPLLVQKEWESIICLKSLTGLTAPVPCSAVYLCVVYFFPLQLVFFHWDFLFVSLVLTGLGLVDIHLLRLCVCVCVGVGVGGWVVVGGKVH